MIKGRGRREHRDLGPFGKGHATYDMVRECGAREPCGKYENDETDAGAPYGTALGDANSCREQMHQMRAHSPITRALLRRPVGCANPIVTPVLWVGAQVTPSASSNKSTDRANAIVPRRVLAGVMFLQLELAKLQIDALGTCCGGKTQHYSSIVLRCERLGLRERTDRSK
jgi:hypothetical protein